MNLKKKNIIPLVLLACVIVGLLVLDGFLLVWVQQSSSNIKRLKTELKSVSERFSYLSYWSSSEEESRLSKLEDVFIDPKDPLPFFERLENIADNLSLTLEISSLRFSETEKNIGQGTMSLSVVGSFSNCLVFWDELQKSPHLLEVKNASIFHVKGESRLNLTIEITTYEG